jgi:choline dehydrogenase-like flavoprotein
VAAWALARSGRSVLLVERGGVPTANGDHLRSPRTDGSVAYLLGGGTRVYGAQTWRFMPEDFAMASTYGVPDGSALADWPIGYDDIEPFYTMAEYEIGVCGSDAPHAGATPRSRPYPMPPFAGDRSWAPPAGGRLDPEPDNEPGTPGHQLHPVRRPPGMCALPAVHRVCLPD